MNYKGKPHKMTNGAENGYDHARGVGPVEGAAQGNYGV